MKSRLFGLLAASVAVLGLVALTTLAGQQEGDNKDKAAIQKNAEGFIEAFHKGDADAVAAFWTPDGDYTDQTGRNLKGREAIAAAFKKFFGDNKDLKLRIDSKSLRFVTPDVAIEDGTTEVIPPDGGPPSRARYTIVHVKKNEQWQLSSVRDAAYSPPGNAEQLGDLEWLVGEWAEEGDKEAAHVSFEWSEGQNFLVSDYATTFKNISLGGGTQWIGWDPRAKQLRSWAFDISGGFGEGSWSKDGDKWVIKTTTVLPDGKQIAATNIMTRVDPDTVTWQSKDRTMDGKPVPEIKEIKLKRQK